MRGTTKLEFRACTSSENPYTEDDASWTGAINTYTSNDVYASVTLQNSNGTYSDMLRFYNISAAQLALIPDLSNLVRITVVMEAKGDAISPPRWYGTPSRVELWLDDVYGDDGKAGLDDTTLNATEKLYATSGVGELWGSGFTVGSDIKINTFGFQTSLCAHGGGGAGVAYVDYAYILVDWAMPTTPGSAWRYRNRPPLKRNPARLGGYN